MAAMTSTMAIVGKLFVAVRFPSNPAIEFIRMNTTDVAEATFVGAQRMRIISGVRKMRAFAGPVHSDSMIVL